MLRLDKIVVSQLTGWRRKAGKTPGIITQTVVRMETIRIRAEGGGWLGCSNYNVKDKGKK